MENSRKLVLIEAFDAVFDAVSELAEMERKKVLGLVDELLDVEQEQISREVNELLDDEELAPMEDLPTNRICQPYPKEEFTRNAVRQLTGFRQAQVYNVLVTAARVAGYRHFFSPTEIGRMVFARFDDRDHMITHSSPSALVADPLYTLQHLSLVEADGEPSSRDRRYRLADHVSLNVDATFANTEINSACGRRIV